MAFRDLCVVCAQFSGLFQSNYCESHGLGWRIYGGLNEFNEFKFYFHFYLFNHEFSLKLLGIHAEDRTLRLFCGRFMRGDTRQRSARFLG